MSEPSDNKQQEEGDNKPVEEKEPNLPNQDVEEEEQQTEEPQTDPEMQKWIEETKSLDNAYKRVQGSKAEVEKWRKQAEEIQKSHEDFQKQIAEELREVYKKDPETAEKLFGVKLQEQQQAQQEQQQPQQLDPESLKEEVSVAVRADMEVNNFREKYGDKIGDENDWEAIKDIAKSFVGKKDRNNNPYTIQTALMDALLIRHPESIGDKAISEYLSAKANRDSAAMPGDIPGGPSEEEPELSDDEMQMLKSMKVPKSVIDGVKRRKAQRLKK